LYYFALIILDCFIFRTGSSVTWSQLIYFFDCCYIQLINSCIGFFGIPLKLKVESQCYPTVCINDKPIRKCVPLSHNTDGLVQLQQFPSDYQYSIS